MTASEDDMRGFWVREIGGVRLLTPYSSDFIDALKQAVPFRSLHWDREAKSWIVKQPYVEAALDVASDYYDSLTELRLPGATGADRPSAPPPSNHSGSQCLAEVKRVWSQEAALHLLPGAPGPVVHAAYRALALLCHPDKGGSHERMVEINNAYGLLKKLGKA